MSARVGGKPKLRVLVLYNEGRGRFGDDRGVMVQEAVLQYVLIYLLLLLPTADVHAASCYRLLSV